MPCTSCDHTAAGGLAQIVRAEGAKGLYRGLGPTLMALLPNWAVSAGKPSDAGWRACVLGHNHQTRLDTTIKHATSHEPPSPMFCAQVYFTVYDKLKTTMTCKPNGSLAHFVAPACIGMLLLVLAPCPSLACCIWHELHHAAAWSFRMLLLAAAHRPEAACYAHGAHGSCSGGGGGHTAGNQPTVGGQDAHADAKHGAGVRWASSAHHRLQEHL